MRRWRAKPGIGFWIALLLLLLTLAGVAFFGLRVTLPFMQQPPVLWQIDLATYIDLLAFVALLLLSGVLLYRIVGVLTLAYEMDRNGLYIVWVGNRAVVPLSQVEAIESGAPQAVVPWWLFHIVGYYWGRGRTASGKLLHLFTTRSPTRSLVIQTASEAYAISPADQETFVQEMEQRRRIGAVKSLTPTVEPGRIFFYAFWNDQLIRWALILTFGLNLLLLGMLAARYPQLTTTIEMRFNAAGQATELRPRHQVLFMPLAAFVLSLLNTALGLSFYRQDRTGAQLLQLGSVVIQVLFGVAILAILAG